MPSADDKQNEQLAELQSAALAALRQQQEAFLAGVKAWRESLAQHSGEGVTWPDLKLPHLSPSPSELVEASYAFTAKLLAEQSQFLTELGKAMAVPKNKS